jgi:hypothetical protein
VDAVEAVLAHEAGDTLAAYPDLEAEAQLGMHTWGAMGPAAAGMDLTDPLPSTASERSRSDGGRDAQAY